MQKKNRLNTIAFFINGLLFLMSGISLIEDGKLVFATIQLLASILNITMVLKIKMNRQDEKFNYILLAMNIIVCISFAIDNILANKSYIQFLWIIAAIPPFLALIFQIKRKKTSLKNG